MKDVVAGDDYEEEKVNESDHDEATYIQRRETKIKPKRRSDARVQQNEEERSSYGGLPD